MNAKDYFDEAVRYVIMVLIFVFDPFSSITIDAAYIIKDLEECQNREKEN